MAISTIAGWRANSPPNWVSASKARTRPTASGSTRLEEDGRKYGVRGVPFEPDRWLVNGDQVTVGELVLDVYHCPGHTPGHVVFHHAPSKLAIVGDVLFQGSIGRTDFPKGNHQDLIDAITGRLWPLGDDTVFVPGHGQPSNFAHERRTNPFVSDAALQRSGRFDGDLRRYSRERPHTPQERQHRSAEVSS